MFLLLSLKTKMSWNGVCYEHWPELDTYSRLVQHFKWSSEKMKSAVWNQPHWDPMRARNLLKLCADPVSLEKDLKTFFK